MFSHKTFRGAPADLYCLGRVHSGSAKISSVVYLLPSKFFCDDYCSQFLQLQLR